MAHLCRYLVTGSDSASLYLQVQDIHGQDIICQAQNGAVMDGLMTVSRITYSTLLLVPMSQHVSLQQQQQHRSNCFQVAKFWLESHGEHRVGVQWLCSSDGPPLNRCLDKQ